MAINSTFPERVKAVITKLGGITQASQKTGLSTSVLSQYSNGKSEPSRTRLMNIADAANVGLAWLATGQDDTMDQTLHILPYYGSKLESGPKIVRQRLIQYSTIPITDLFLKNILGRDSIENLGFFDIHGDCMTPTLNRGEWVIANLSDTDVNTGIYIIESGGETHFRRLQTLMGDDGPYQYKIMYDNKNMYETESISRESPDTIHIIGRVIWHGRRM